MPSIPEYTANATVSSSVRGLSLLQPDDRGMNAVANMGRTQSALANAAGNEIESGVRGVTNAAVKATNDYFEHKDVMKFNQDQPDYWAAGVLGWKNAANKSDITDPDQVAQFNKGLEEQDQAFIDQFKTEKGQALALNEVRRRRDHLSQVQIADIATRTGEQAIQSITGNVAKSSAIVQQDPHFLDTALQNTDDMVARLKDNPALTEEQRAGLDRFGETSKREITQTAFLTMAQANPTAAKAAIESGWMSNILKPEDRQQMTRLATVYENEARASKDRDLAQAARMEREQTEAASSDIYKNHFSADTGQWTNLPGFAKDMMALAAGHPTTAAPVVKAGLDMVERLTKEANGAPLPVADPSTAEDFRKRMLLPQNDPNRLSLAEVYNARARGLVSDQQVSLYKSAVEDIPKDPGKAEFERAFSKFLDGIKPSITGTNPMLGTRFPMQDQKFYQYEVDMRGQLEATYKSGGDWKAMLNPSSANYLGTQVGPYQLSNKEGIKAYVGSMGRDATPGTLTAPAGNDKAIRPGESIEAWLKRTGG